MTLTVSIMACTGHFGQQHRNVLRAIAEMRAGTHGEIAEHGLLNFEQSSYVNAQGKRQPMYRMTADGLSELAMSFTGDAARVVRIRFVSAFKDMAQRLEQQEKLITQMLHEHSKKAAAAKPGISVAGARGLEPVTAMSSQRPPKKNGAMCDGH